MRDTGLFSFCGVPGSGKTLTCVKLALKHYKNENSPFKRVVARFKYKIAKNRHFCNFQKYLKKFNLYNILYNKYKLWSINHNTKVDVILKKLLKILFLLFKYFVYLYVVVYLFFDFNLFLLLIFICFLNRIRIIKWFDSLDYEYYSLFPKGKINNIYSNVPILLDKKNDIYSHKLSLWDLLNNYSFLPNSILIIDEIQLFVDSDEYKEKMLADYLNDLGNFNQAHRHFGIRNIYVTSQGVTRIVKKVRDVCSGYMKLSRVFKIPFLPYGFIRGIIYYDIDFFGKHIPRDRQKRKELPFDYKKYFCFCNLSKVYSSYDSRYLANLNYSKPLLSRGLHDSLKVSESDIKSIFSKPKFMNKSNKHKDNESNNKKTEKLINKFFS